MADTSPLLGLYLVASCNVAPFPSTCSVSPIWCICLLNLWSAPPAILSPLPLPALVLCSPCGGSCRRVHDLFLSSVFASSFSLPCCRQRIHYECLARSVHACGDYCPFCTQDLAPSCLTLFWQPPLNTSTFPSISTRSLRILHSVLSVSLMEATSSSHFLPLEHLDDRLVGLFNGFVVHAVRQDIPALPTVSCPQCSSSAAIVFDRPTGRVVRFCVSCQLVVPHDSVSPPLMNLQVIQFQHGLNFSDSRILNLYNPSKMSSCGILVIDSEIPSHLESNF